jgi:hypothetical protein
MKKLIAIALIFACVSVQAQKFGQEFGLAYVYANPVSGMGQVIQRGDGLTIHYGLFKPQSPFSFGIETTFVRYGVDKSRQDYAMDDGTTAPMDIIVTNSFTNMMVYGRWYAVNKGLFRPFLFGKLGYSVYSTDLNIFDPDDKDHCEPVDTDVLYDDGTVVASIGAGAKLDIASFFKKLHHGRFFLEGSINFTQGGQVHYMSEDADVSHANRLFK